jgi:hypothetical protein
MDQKIFYENKNIRGFFVFESSFQTCFWNLFSSSGLSQICLVIIGNGQKPRLRKFDYLRTSFHYAFSGYAFFFCFSFQIPLLLLYLVHIFEIIRE